MIVSSGVPGIERVLLPSGVNQYVVGRRLIEAGSVIDIPVVATIVRRRRIEECLLTHVHPRHAGLAQYLREHHNVRVLIGSGDVGALGRRFAVPGRVTSRIARLLPPALPEVDLTLSEGAQFAGFAVLDLRGHTAGHIGLWREADRVLICGDALAVDGDRFVAPRDRPTMSGHAVRESLRRLAWLEPTTVLPGHGAPKVGDGVKNELRALACTLRI